ncbi:hypothetical protein BDF19DRAFT_435408 [Syncephalis fuscata]|nr:hypothetical protein BDF19DRAFT_435408 [Syncephalis fuscata]
MARFSIKGKSNSYTDDSSRNNMGVHASEAGAYVNRKGELVLYKDRFACLTSRRLKLYDYYMTGLSRSFPVEKIMAVVPTDDLGLSWEDRSSSGPALRSFIFWSSDWRRGMWGVRQNEDVVIVVQDEKWRKGFSLNNRAKFISLLQSLIDKTQSNKPNSDLEIVQERKYLQ